MKTKTSKKDNSTDNQHFDGLLKDDSRSPSGFQQLVGDVDVLIEPNTGKLVLTGIKPNELHNCDRRGCGSIEHKIAEFDIDPRVLEPYRNHVITDNGKGEEE